VDVKHCHGYLGHELLSARERAGRYGGAGLEERTGFLRRVLEGIRARAPGLAVGVRLSAYDMTPYRPGEDGVGEPEAAAPYPFAFGGDGTGTGIDLAETSQLLSLFEGWGVGLVCLTAGSPYYNPHIQRPAFYPPSDGYKPPEDPLVGVARMIGATAELKRRHPGLVIVGSGYSYLQEWLPHVAQRVVADGGVDSVGIGRMALSYPELPADVLAGRPLATKAICRTFSDCTTAPRNGLVSGCYPIDPFYKRRPEAERLAEVKARAAGRGAARSGNT
jgi:2,4-dienoyl-CoA reductase-like NADH-dependent reductase (Old Yellow Enzyme family)